MDNISHFYVIRSISLTYASVTIIRICPHSRGLWRLNKLPDPPRPADSKGGQKDESSSSSAPLSRSLAVQRPLSGSRPSANNPSAVVCPRATTPLTGSLATHCAHPASHTAPVEANRSEDDVGLRFVVVDSENRKSRKSACSVSRKFSIDEYIKT